MAKGHNLSMHNPNSSLHYTDNKIFLKDTSLTELVDQNKTPFYLYDKKALLHNFFQYKKAADKNDIKSTICFALKSNNNLELLQELAKNGCGADIVSSGELKQAIKAGIDPKKIVFSGVGKTRDDIELGIEHSILSFNVESLSELKLINSIAKEKSAKVNIAFRLNPQVHAKTHKHISTGFKTHKFGLLKDDILEAFQDKTLWEYTKLIGLSIHIGSQLKCLEATKKAIRELCILAKQIDTELEFIDVGGGLGVNYQSDDEQAPSIEQYINEVALITKEYFENMMIVFEPGRSISASCGYLVSRVIRSKSSEGYNFLIVDGGMNDFVRPALYGAYHEIYASKDSEEKIETDIVGPICETADCFGQKRLLPKLEENDFIIICDAGAYGHTMSSHYNMREKPKELVLD